MAKMIDESPQGSVPEDSAGNATPNLCGEWGDRRDVLIVPGVGVCFSKHRVREYERDVEAECNERGEGIRYGGDESFHQMMIPEDAILEFAREIQKHRSMESNRQSRHGHEEVCYEGTDTVDPEKEESVVSDRRNVFRLDRSQSSILINVANTGGGGKLLNGSEVRHSRFITIELQTPDGRRYGHVSMSFEQFSRALVTCGHVPCTWDDYWSFEEDTVRLSEVVKEPDDISGRAGQRMADQIKSIQERITGLQIQAQERIDAGKGMSKGMLAEMIKTLGLIRDQFGSNAEFVISQAQEEVTGIAERALVDAMLELQIGGEGGVDSPAAQALLKTAAARGNLLVESNSSLMLTCPKCSFQVSSEEVDEDPECPECGEVFPGSVES